MPGNVAAHGTNKPLAPVMIYLSVRSRGLPGPRDERKREFPSKINIFS